MCSPSPMIYLVSSNDFIMDDNSQLGYLKQIVYMCKKNYIFVKRIGKLLFL